MKGITLTLLLWCVSIFSMAQNREGASGEKMLQQADSLYHAGNYASAALAFEDAIQMYRAANLKDDEARALNGLGQMQWRMFRLVEAKQTVNQALALYERDEPDDSLSILNKAISHNSLGVISGMQSDFQGAMEEFARVIAIGKRDPNSTRRFLGIAHHNIGRLNLKYGNQDSAIFHFEKSIGFRDSTTTEEKVNLADTYYTLGIILTDKGYYNQALGYLDKTLSMQRRVLGEQNPMLANTFSQMGMTYFNLGQYQLATDYIHKAIQMVEGRPEMEKYRLHFYVMLADILIRKEQYDEALPLLTQILNLRLAAPDTDEISFAYTYDYFAEIYVETGQVDEAQKYAERSLEIKERILGLESTFRTDTYAILARTHHLLGDDEKANGYLDKGIGLLNRSSYRQSPALGHLYNLKAEFLLDNQQYQESIAVLEKALRANARSVQPNGARQPTSEVLDRQIRLASMALLAKNHYKIFETNQSQASLQASLAGYASCDSLMDKIRKSSIRFEDRVIYGDYAQTIYGEAIQSCIGLHELTGQSFFREKAFYFAEKAKVSALSDNLQAIAAKEATNLPDSVWKVEEQIKVDLSRCQSEINDHLVTDDADKKGLITDLESQRFQLELELDSFYTYLDQQDREYYRLKYDNEVVELSTVQEGLAEDEMILEYFSFDSTLFAFAITRSGLTIHQTKDYPEVKEVARKFVALFNDFDHNKQSIQAFEQHAYQLYKYLLSDQFAGLSPEIGKIIIMSTPELSMIPWDLLVSSLGDSTSASLDYLINQYTIHYGYSSTLHFRKTSKKKRNQRNILAIAPSYQGSTPNAGLRLTNAFREESEGLRWNKSEVEAIKGFFDNTTVWQNEDAQESEFKTQASNYNILHLAMHAFIDHQESMNSKLVFTDKDSLEDGALHTHELFNMELDSDLAILSACQTGAGKIDKGEGVISLARGFAYAGVPAIVMSHWKVDDRSTGELMHGFYKYLSAGQQKSEALRNAKLDFLHRASPNKKHPYYWGAFVTIGDDTPIVRQDRTTRWIWFTVFLLGVPIIFLIRKVFPK